MRSGASALLAVALLLTACSAAATPSPTARPTSPIAADYLDVVAPLNAATCEFNALLSQTAPTLADLTRGSADYAARLATVIDGLRAIDWPAEIGADAHALIDALAADETSAQAMASADTLQAFIKADDQLIEANAASAAAARQLRRDLGLGSAGNPCVT